VSTAKGKQAEDAACKYLEKKGYQVVERNKRLGRGELDIVASLEDILAFVEVKGHQQRRSSLEAMHQGKQQRMVSAAQTWRGQHPDYMNHQCRFDLVIVTPSSMKILPPTIEHLRDIIRL